MVAGECDIIKNVYMENIADYTPAENGCSHYSVRLGPVWGIVLVCGEDKDDSHPEHGHTVCCHSFCREETEYLGNIVKHADEEYDGEGVTYKLVICRTPFAQTPKTTFDIEREFLKKWADILKENVKPHLMPKGHNHRKRISPGGGKSDGKGQICTVIVATEAEFGENPRYEWYTVTFDGKSAKTEFTDKDRNVSNSEIIKLKNNARENGH